MKNMKTRYLAYAALPALIAGVAIAGNASAHGWFMSATPEEIASRHTAMFEAQAKLLGMSVDEFKAAWAEGKTLREIAEAKGISEEELRTRMQNERTAHMKAQLQTLVEKGVITQAQADARAAAMESRVQSGPKGMRGFGHGFFR